MTHAQSSLPVYLTIDVGPADAVLGIGHSANGSWTRTESGLRGLKKVFQSVEERTGSKPVATWFVRSDFLVEQQFADRLAIFRTHRQFWEQCVLQGDELGWMPQLYSSNSREIRYDDLARTHKSLVDDGVAPKSVRMGDCYHDNRTIAELDRLGILFDSSAVPGRAKTDHGWRMNWLHTPSTAYRPSVNNYQIPGKPTLGIVEIPISVSKIDAPYDPVPLNRYVNPCMNRRFLWQNFRQLIRSSSYIVCILHPDEIVHNPVGHPLIAYSPGELQFNLEEMIRAAGEEGRQVSFHTIGSFTF